jgi:anti-sigma factor RsiW
MSDRKKPELDELHAYVDGQLDATRHHEVHAYLIEHPDEAAIVLDYQTINQSLHTLFDDVLNEPVPVRQHKLQRRRYRHWLMRAASVAGLLLFGGIIGWLIRDQTASELSYYADTPLDQAILAHALYTREVRHAVEVPVEQEEHLVAWLSKRLDTKLQAPQLSRYGFKLLGGRLLPIGHGPAAQFMYQDSSGRRLTLYLWRETGDNGDTALRFVHERQTNAFYWIDRQLGCALIGDIDRATLSDMADVVYEQLAFQ